MLHTQVDVYLFPSFNTNSITQYTDKVHIYKELFSTLIAVIPE